MDWTTLFLYVYPIVEFIVGALLCQAVCELAACFRRWRCRATANRILDSVPDDVPYLPLPDQQASSCMICLAEYAHGDGRFVMPGCVHAFHRGCIAEWLRQGKTTCPICRAASIVVVPAQVAGEDDDAVPVSTAEDMV